jgi:hypothetical protein
MNPALPLQPVQSAEIGLVFAKMPSDLLGVGGCERNGLKYLKIVLLNQFVLL